MSWLRSAVSKAVEVGNKNNITRTFKNYADTVVHHAGQAVAEGSKLIQDRIVARNFKSARQTMKRLEEAAVSSRGPERTVLLKRWLAVLKEIDNQSRGSFKEEDKAVDEHLFSDEAKENPRKSPLVLYYDPDVGGTPMDFRDIFLQSQALEGVTLSMILEAPNEEEVPLLLEMFEICLTGGKEVHNAILSGIQDLAKAFSSYENEVLVKREELLQFAQGAITGLKINADLGRVDVEVSSLKKKLDGMTASLAPLGDGQDKAAEGTTSETIEALKPALEQIRVCSQLEGLLLKKKSLNNGDSPDIHTQKVDKLKVLSESLSNSSAKSEKRISDQRVQKEEALKVRAAKASHVGEKEKEIGNEIEELERQRDDLEAQLKKVNSSLAAAQARLRNTREERDQFEEANDQIVAHLKTKEDELVKSIASCKVEADVLSTWINFLEDTWKIQCLYTETKEKQTSDELGRHEDFTVKLAVDLLSNYKKEVGPSISRIRKFVESLKILVEERSENASSVENDESKILNPRRNLEEEYLDYEAKIITTFSVVDNMKEQLYAPHVQVSRKDDARVQELFNDIEKLREEFESIERPNLEMETPTPKAESQSIEERQSSSSDPPAGDIKSPKARTAEPTRPPPTKPEQAVLSPEAELAKLESEFGKVGEDYSAEEIGEWEFDELERELRSGESKTS